jgi:hypothetical protein
MATDAGALPPRASRRSGRAPRARSQRRVLQAVCPFQQQYVCCTLSTRCRRQPMQARAGLVERSIAVLSADLTAAN